MKRLLLLLLLISTAVAFADPERVTDPGINSSTGVEAQAIETGN